MGVILIMLYGLWVFLSVGHKGDKMKKLVVIVFLLGLSDGKAWAGEYAECAEKQVKAYSDISADSGITFLQTLIQNCGDK